MDEIFRIPLSKTKLKLLPTADRGLFFLSSHAVNQISLLRKLTRFSLNYQSESELENTLSAAQSQMLIRLFFGAMAEAWEMVKRPKNQRLIGQVYLSQMNPDGRTAFKGLKQHFGSSNFLRLLRNKIVYHFPETDEFEMAFQNAKEGADWSWYPADTIDNSFYLATEHIIHTRMAQLVGEQDVEKAFKTNNGNRDASFQRYDFFSFCTSCKLSLHVIWACSL